ncbi:hypothetical protein KEM48_012964 [Puccinia striiformis f. sp. tritici PST-130]|nr:hypothetical protein KEM48_012964 [Puccinia striiformis f. sp. tritici PST-130]
MSSSHGPSAERDSKRKRSISPTNKNVSHERRPASPAVAVPASGSRQEEDDDDPLKALDQKVMQLQHRIGGIQHFDWLVQINPDPHSRRLDHIKLLQEAVLKLQNRLAGVENLASEMNSNSDSKSKQAGSQYTGTTMIRIEHTIMQIEQRFDTFQQRIDEQFERLERQLGVPKSSATIMREVKEEHARFEEARGPTRRPNSASYKHYLSSSLSTSGHNIQALTCPIRLLLILLMPATDIDSTLPPKSRAPCLIQEAPPERQIKRKRSISPTNDSDPPVQRKRRSASPEGERRHISGQDEEKKRVAPSDERLQVDIPRIHDNDSGS